MYFFDFSIKMFVLLLTRSGYPSSFYLKGIRVVFHGSPLTGDTPFTFKQLSIIAHRSYYTLWINFTYSNNAFQFIFLHSVFCCLSRRIPWKIIMEMQKIFFTSGKLFVLCSLEPSICSFIMDLDDYGLVHYEMNVSNTKLTKRRTFLMASLSVNLGLLGYFKYGNFILDNFIFGSSGKSIGKFRFGKFTHR